MATSRTSIHPLFTGHSSIMLKTFKFISFIIALTVAVSVQATPTIPNVSMLTMCLLS